jgi:hypothetical protein
LCYQVHLLEIVVPSFFATVTKCFNPNAEGDAFGQSRQILS